MALVYPHTVQAVYDDKVALRVEATGWDRESALFNLTRKFVKEHEFDDETIDKMLRENGIDFKDLPGVDFVQEMIDNVLEDVTEFYANVFRRKVIYEMRKRGIDAHQFTEYADEAENQNGFNYWIDKMHGSVEEVIADYSLYVDNSC